MSNIEISKTGIPWNRNLFLLFRIVFVFLLLQILPWDLGFFKKLNAGSGPGWQYEDLFNIAHYYPDLLANVPVFGDWLVYILIAVVLGSVWSYAERKQTSAELTTRFDDRYYLLRVVLRYRLALALLAYGFIKFYPLQAPYPSISNLNTNYGDYTRWKLFGLSLGIVPSYQSFLGGVEIILALLLLYRRTASLAAFIIIVFTGNVFMSNIAYEGGEVVYSLFLLSLALGILLYDLQRLLSLLIFQRPTKPNLYKPGFFTGWKNYGRYALKLSFIAIFVVLYGFKTKTGYVSDQFQYPSQPGLAGVSGIYTVSTFVLAGDTLAWSKTDPARWLDIVFEKWNTISIRSNRRIILDSGNVDKVTRIDSERSYELIGTGGRHYYSYKFDSSSNTLLLENRNPHYPGEKLSLQYKQVNDSTVLLSGTNESGKAVYAELKRKNKKYLLEEVRQRGRRKSFKL